MAVKISKLFKDSRFKDLPNITKLLYIYLSTNPDLNTVGVFSPNLEVVCIEVGCDMEELKESSKRLTKLKYIYVKKFDDWKWMIATSFKLSEIDKVEIEQTAIKAGLALGVKNGIVKGDMVLTKEDLQAIVNNMAEWE